MSIYQIFVAMMCYRTIMLKLLLENKNDQDKWKYQLDNLISKTNVYQYPA